jgi:NAD(P)-dependent dehydrogenase (short-subunit alcohol dehydrogenase family)
MIMPTMLITGGSGGLGRCVVDVAKQHGWTVLAPTSAQLDVASADAVQRYVETTCAEMHAVVHVVGGIIAGKPVDETTTDDVDAMLTLNVRTTFNVIRASMPMLRRQGGSIVTVAARDILHPLPNRAAYASSKAAVAALTLTVAEEGRPYGVRANCVVPSIIRTDANRAWADDETVRQMVDPMQIAAAIVDLCRDNNPTSGALLPMYGGFPY